MALRTRKPYWADFLALECFRGNLRAYFIICGRHQLAGQKVRFHELKKTKVPILWHSESLLKLEATLRHLEA